MAAVAWTEHDGSETIAHFWPMFERRARRFVSAKGAEFDDLVQEAAIASWGVILDGWLPNKTIVDRACMNYVRSLHRGGWRLRAESW